MKIFYFLISVFILFNSNVTANDLEKAKEIIELRQSSMQGIWARIKRLAPYIDLESNIEYTQSYAKQDAQDIKLLLEKSMRLWPKSTDLSTKNLTNATPATWAVENYFQKLYKNALLSASNLELALNDNDWDRVDLEMCNLGNACGTCHASFRRLLTSQLANEASAWSGKYTKKCN